MTKDKREHLEREVLQYREQVSALQDRLDSVTKVRDEEQSDERCVLSVSYPVFGAYPHPVTVFILSIPSLLGV